MRLSFRKCFGIAVFVTFFASVVAEAKAELIDRGDNMFYDTELDITWIVDTKRAQTLGYDEDGIMTQSQAYSFAAQLEYGGFDDWRLPFMLPKTAVSTIPIPTVWTEPAMQATTSVESLQSLDISITPLLETKVRLILMEARLVVHWTAQALAQTTRGP